VRLFVAVTPDPEVIARFAAAQGALRRHAPSAKWVSPDGMHLTLAFLGERDPADAARIAGALEAAVGSRAPFVLRLRGGGAFGRPARPRVLWIGCEGAVDALRALHADVLRALAPFGHEPDRRDLTAHLTLCRAREQGGDRDLAACLPLLRDQDFGEVRVGSVELYESRLSGAGPRVAVVSRAPLTG
jgi:2'-5' RNA ligase